MMELRELTLQEIFLRIFLAVFLGGVIGMERGKKNRPAGLRTYMLVCIGSCVVMMTNQYIYQIYHTGDLVRLGAQVISGIGFLGAGTIVVTPRNQIKGLTTATVYLILAGMQKLDFSMRSRTAVLEGYVELDKTVPFSTFVSEVRKRNVELNNLQFLQAEIDGIISFTAAFRKKGKFEHETLIQELKSVKGVYYIEEL